MKKKIIQLLLIVMVATLVGCGKEKDNGVTVTSEEVTGKWVLSNTQEYWRYDATGSGETWDEGEDVQEGEGTKFSWNVKGDQLQIVLQGEMGQVVPYDYTVVAMSGQEMKLRDEYDVVKTYNKK